MDLEFSEGRMVETAATIDYLDEIRRRSMNEWLLKLASAKGSEEETVVMVSEWVNS